MTTSDYAAWWGAIVSTCVLFWDVVKWTQRGAKISVTTSYNMHPVGAKGEPKFVYIQIANMGERPATISGISFGVFNNLFFRLIDRPQEVFAFPYPVGGSKKMPFLLDPGETWTGLLPQDAAVEDWVNNKILVIHVTHTGRGKKTRRQVVADSCWQYLKLNKRHK